MILKGMTDWSKEKPIRKDDPAYKAVNSIVKINQLVTHNGYPVYRVDLNYALPNHETNTASTTKTWEIKEEDLEPAFTI